jgi:apolipoprotein N-acyltransferase
MLLGPVGPLRAHQAGALAVLGGVVGVAAFPRSGIWPLAFLSVAMLSVAVDGRRPRTAAWLGYAYGLAFLAPLLSWTGVYVGPFPWLLLAAFEALYFAAMGAALTLVQSRRCAPVLIGAIWVLQEAVRDRAPFGGFPWGRLAFSQSTSPMRWFIALGGAPLLSFAVAVAGGGLAIAVRDLPGGPPRARRTMFCGLALLVAVPAAGGVLAAALRPSGGLQTSVALIQGSVPDLGLAFEDRAGQVLDNHISQTLVLAAEIKSGTVARPSLVVWPENASDLDPFQDPAVYQRIDSTVREIGIPILVGAILQGPGPTHRRNVGILWAPATGPGDEYTKRHPVPFGEYIPLRSIARRVSSDVDLVPQDMVAGHGDGLVTGGPFPIGDVICFEVAYDDLVRSSVRAGAQLLVVQTNNATFGHTSETYQQLAMSRLRAVESGRTVLQVATTGLSAAIRPDGAIAAQSHRLFTPDVIVADMPLRTATTLATRLGVAPEAALVAVAVSALAWSTVSRRRAQRARRARNDKETVNG